MAARAARALFWTSSSMARILRGNVCVSCREKECGGGGGGGGGGRRRGRKLKAKTRNGRTPRTDNACAIASMLPRMQRGREAEKEGARPPSGPADPAQGSEGRIHLIEEVFKRLKLGTHGTKACLERPRGGTNILDVAAQPDKFLGCGRRACKGLRVALEAETRRRAGWERGCTREDGPQHSPKACGSTSSPLCDRYTTSMAIRQL